MYLKQSLEENVDFYYNEAGLMVMTEKYHLRRGYCCGSGCLHCPYGYERVAGNRRNELIALKNKRDGKAEGSGES